MYAVELRNVTKRFGVTVANDAVTFQVKKGEIHSLLGENGAGKTTLMKIIYGMHNPDEGEIWINGSQVNYDHFNPSIAINKGIAMVHQHFMLVDTMTVTENVVLGYEAKKGLFFDKQKSVNEVARISDKYGLKVDPRAIVEDLPVGTKQRIEILKALYRDADILILDEPTAVLTPLEVEDLFRVLVELKNAGKSIIIITHKLKETMAIADRTTILRNGETIETLDTKTSTTEQLAELMVGRKVSFDAPATVDTKKEKLLEINDLTVRNGRVPVIDGLNLSLFGGEILGIAGVEGNGQSELIEVLTGLLSPNEGKVIFKEKEIQNLSPIQVINAGIGHIPEDRTKSGLINDFSIKDNLILGYHNKPMFQKNKVFNTKKITEHGEMIRTNYQVKSSNTDMPVSALSGGNQQKIVIGRVLSQDPDVIIAAQPTRGVDIGAIEYIHQQLFEMRNKGKAVLLISAELDEIRKLSDNIAVIYEGKIVAYDRAENFSEYELGSLMTGGTKKKEVETGRD
ncbi:ABC transporter ATP-binding protein [Radiobacillus sp. PE A8.2]|uniref:ABC transporter ATP-binding protein n=1 Tax=Radiobacillus sp. PE A8.2 TaxID=3380349 RepID=UPI00388D3195